MGRINSYYDWELQFRKKPKNKALDKNEDNELNSLGIPRREYKRFLDEWEAKNPVSYK